MKPWRCQICGETYLGTEPADRCPYCGVPGKNLVSAAEYIDYGVVEMSEKSRKNCLHAIELEVNNTAFYKKCADNAETQISKAIFKRLGKHEGEHAELFADMLGIEEEDLPEVEIPENDSARFEEAHDHEQKAIKFYLDVARNAPEPRLREVFSAISDIEQEHLNLSNLYK
ncbi:MAG: ferritin family protein [Halanaerobiaceae bacterium]